MNNNHFKRRMVQLSEPQVLAQRLQAIGLNDFVEKTRIDQKIGAKKLYYASLMLAIDESIHEYARYARGPIDRLVRMRKFQILQAILKNQQGVAAEIVAMQ